jgi:hypothetical protein
MNRYLVRLLLSLLYALTLSVTSQAQGIDVSMFKRVNWNSTQYQVKLREKAQFVSADVNYSTHQPMLEYSTLLAGKPSKLNYDFEGGLLSSITYQGVFGFDENNRLKQGGSLEEVLDYFININAELFSLFGSQCGCDLHGYYFGHYELYLKIGVIYPKVQNCEPPGQMNKYKIYSLAREEFQEDAEYCSLNKLNYEKTYEAFTYAVYYEYDENLYELRIQYFPKEHFLGLYESNCLLTITPKRKDVICE